MLKTIRSFRELVLKTFRANNNEVVGSGGGKADETVVNLLKNKKSRKSTHMPNIGAIKKPNFPTPDAKKAFNHLRLAFIKAPIFRYFDLENHIRIKTDISSYAIDKMLSQLNVDFNKPPNDLKDFNLNKSDFGQWHLVAYFFRKMIPAETQYKTYDTELMAILKTFKTWRYYLKSCKDKVFIPTHHNNFRRFMDMNSLSFCQVW